jgi:hypothetical protein
MQKDLEEMTPLHLSTRHRSPKCLALLLKFMAPGEVDTQDKNKVMGSKGQRQMKKERDTLFCQAAGIVTIPVGGQFHISRRPREYFLKVCHYPASNPVIGSIISFGWWGI